MKPNLKPATRASALSLVHVYPQFLGSYGHGGNALVLAQRCRWRGVTCDIHEVTIGEVIPAEADIYYLAGGDTVGVKAVAQALQQQQGLQQAAARGAVVFGVGSGCQLLGERLSLPRGDTFAGIGLLDLTSEPAVRRRFGPVIGEPLLPIEAPLLGFEDHQMTLQLGAEATAIAKLRHGAGNGSAQGTEGIWRSNVFGTSLRGPVLALNPSFADLLLERVLGPLDPLPLLAVDRLRERFLSALPRSIGSRAKR